MTLTLDSPQTLEEELDKLDTLIWWEKEYNNKTYTEEEIKQKQQEIIEKWKSKFD